MVGDSTGLRAVIPLDPVAHCPATASPQKPFAPGAPSAPAVAATRRSAPVAPFRLIGNIYYVGTTDVAAYMIKGRYGMVLIDGGYEETAEQILASVRALGFEPHMIRYLLNSHAHYDHAGGLAALKRATGATLYAGRGDSAVLARGGIHDPGFGEKYPFPPVTVEHPVTDGDRIELGDQLITALATPGHTQGCTTWVTTVVEGGKSYPVLFICSLSIPGYDLKHHPPYPGIVDDYYASIARLARLPCVVWLMPHAAQFGLDEKRKRMGGATNPFIDQAGCRAYLGEAKQKINRAMH